MIIEKICPENRERALSLVLSVFMQYEAPDYSELGIRTFTDFINNKEATDSLQMYGAFMNGELVGVIAARNEGNHIALFFVDSKYHRQGIGRKLFEKVVTASTADKITVNSSPFAVAVYQKLGFVPDCGEMLSDGLRYTPMTYYKDDLAKQYFKIQGIPAILWGDHSAKVFVAVHGNMSHKEDDVIRILAEKLTQSGYQVLSFDLPQHGERKDDPMPCKVRNCVNDLSVIMEYIKPRWDHISLFACSMGAYFSLLACTDMPFEQCLFLSPVVNMERIIENMMIWFRVSEEELEARKEVTTPIGQILYWDYYCYVKEHPVHSWNQPTVILYGSDDSLCEYDTVSGFSQQFHCGLTVMEHGEHYFHTEEQLNFFRQWIGNHINI